MSINMSEEGFLNVKFVCTKVSKIPDSSSIQLEKWTQLKCLLQILSFHKEIWASSSVSTVKLSLKDHLLNVFNLLESFLNIVNISQIVSHQ